MIFLSGNTNYSLTPNLLALGIPDPQFAGTEWGLGQSLAAVQVYFIENPG